MTLVGCAPSSSSPNVGAPEVVPIVFASPTMARVRPGDTLAAIASRHGVTAADLQGWNGLASGDLEVDQVLFVWPPAESAPVTAPSRIRRQAVAVAPAPPPAVPAAAPPAPGHRIEVERASVRGAGVLGADLSIGSGIDLASSVAALRSYGSIGDEGGLGSRGSLAGGGEAQTFVMALPEARVAVGPAIPDGPVTPPSVPRPGPKACLDEGVAEEIGEEGIVVSHGLDAGQISAGMSGISRYTPRCFPRGTEGTYTVVAEVVVGCDGRVSDVATLDAGVVPDPIVGCIEDTLASAAFPAHALPDGVTFQIPLRFSF